MEGDNISLKAKTIKGVSWNFIGSYANKVIQFVISIVLARLLTPADYGLIGMLGFFMGLASTFIDSGFSSALIQYKDRTNKDFCTVFYVNLCMSLLMYGILALSAPLIAEFYNQPVLTSIIRVYCLTLVIGALTAINSTKLNIELNYRLPTIISSVSAISSGILGLVLAFLGFGVWSLIYQQLANAIIRATLLIYYAPWPIELKFSLSSFKRLFGYGSKILIASLIHTAYANMYPLVIGKQLSAADLGYVSRAQGVNEMAAGTIISVLPGVAFPLLCKVQDDTAQLLDIYEKYIKMSAFLLCPVILFLTGIAKPLVIFLFTEKWEPCVILLQILSVTYIWDGIVKINLNLLYAKGRSDLVLRLEIIKKTIAFAILIGTVFFSNIIVFCLGMTLYSFVALYLNTIYTKKILDFGFKKQMIQISPYMCFSIIIMLEGLLISWYFTNSLVAITVAVLVCIPTYFILCHITHQYAFIETIKIISPKLGKLGVYLNKLI